MPTCRNTACKNSVTWETNSSEGYCAICWAARNKRHPPKRAPKRNRRNERQAERDADEALQGVYNRLLIRSKAKRRQLEALETELDELWKEFEEFHRRVESLRDKIKAERS